MDTTAVFAELLVGGLQTLTWIALIVMTAVGPSVANSVVDTPWAGSALALAAAYALGVVFDRVWDFILDETGIHDRIRNGVRAAVARDRSESRADIDRLRRRLFGADTKTVVELVNYNRSRMRVARASLFNFSMMTVTGLLLVAVRFGDKATTLFPLVLLLGVFLTGAAGLAFWKLTESHDRLLRMVVPEEKESAALS